MNLVTAVMFRDSLKLNKCETNHCRHPVRIGAVLGVASPVCQMKQTPRRISRKVVHRIQNLSRYRGLLEM